MSVRQQFALHVLLFAAAPLAVAARRSSLTARLLYAHVAVVLVFGGFIGGLYSFPLTSRVTISAGSVAYGSLMLTAVVLLVIERDLQIVRDLVKLVVLVNVFKLVFFAAASHALGTEGIVNPYATSADVFRTSFRVVAIGGFLIVLELVLLVAAFERIKARPSAEVVNGLWFVAAFMAVLCFDGLAFPVLSSPTDDRLGTMVSAGLEGKLMLAAWFAVPFALFLGLFRRSVALYGAKPLRVRSLLRPTGTALVREIERQQEELEYQATHDVMTGLANRAMLVRGIEASLERRRADPARTVAVIFLDIDDFKLVNDGHGHASGDRVLVTVADRLRGALGEGDLAARLGGDEFAVLIDSRRPSAAIELCDRLLDRIREPLPAEHGPTGVHASVGIAVADDRSAAEDLVRNADLAMYRAKQLGKDRAEVYTEGLDIEARSTAELVDQIRLAIDEEQFVPHYQPIVDLRSGRIVGVEALVRWHHPRRGVLAPAQFIGIAEQSQSIVLLGGQVLDRVGRDAARWDIAGDADFRISVNVSTRQLQDPALVEQIAAFERSGLPASRLTLEITESTLMSDVTGAVRILEHLRAHGVMISIDDFGTGFSSLAYLRSLPVDVLKIDRSFVDSLGTESGPGGAPLVQAILGLGSLFGLTVIGEGIETEEQRAALVDLGCHYGQGYLFARPLPAADIAALLASPSPLPRPPTSTST